MVQDLWACLLPEAKRRLAAVEAASRGSTQRPSVGPSAKRSKTGAAASGSAAAAAAATNSAARMVAILAEAVAYIRGSRVEDFKPIFDLSKHLVRVLKDADGMGQPATSADDEEPYLNVSLSGQTLQLVLHVTLSHTKVKKGRDPRRVA